MADVRPKVSVIMTTYNHEATLRASLDSALAQQTDFPFEIELADDCSTDGTEAICREYAARYPQRVRYTRNERNLGCRDNYYDTLLRCRGEYVADLAGDDIWTDPTKLARQAAVLDSDPRIMLVHTAWQYLHDDTGQLSHSPFTGTESWQQPVVGGRGLIVPLLASPDAMVVHSCTMMFRKSAFEKAYREDQELFRSAAYPCEDLQLICGVVAQGSVAYLPQVTLSYRVGNASQMTAEEDYARSARFNLGALRLRMRLQEKFNVNMPAVSENNRRLAAFIIGRAFLAADPALLAESYRVMRESRIDLPAASRLKVALRRFPALIPLVNKVRRPRRCR